MDTITQMEQRLRAALEVESLDIADESQLHAGHKGAKGGGGHYALTIVSPSFNDVDTVRRHRMVYEAMGEMMQQQIHALSINALTPDEL